MKRNRVDAIFAEQAKRKRKIAYKVTFIVFLLIIAFILLYLHFYKNRATYITYTEKSDLNYNVYLKENDFFEVDYLEKNNQYIASIIDYISADFNYKLNVNDSSIDYDYLYRIEAIVNVKDKKTNNSLYYHKENLVEEKLVKPDKNFPVDINEKIDIDYNKYNDLINSFVNTYELDGAESTLEIKMHVKVCSNCANIEKVQDKTSVISLSIPLTTKTVAIDMSYDIIDSEEEKILAYKKTETNYNLLIISLTVLLISIIKIILLARFIVTTRTPETIYDIELKKILNNYRSYIQKINNYFDLDGYQVMKVDTFTDMLEIGETIQSPILMLEDEEKTRAYFLIPTNTKIMYMYKLQVSDIKLKKEKKYGKK